MRIFFLAVFLAVLSSPGPRLVAGEEARGSAWLVYWDLKKGLDDLRAMNGALSNVQLFAATFDGDDKPVVNVDLRQHLMENAAAFAGQSLYLTVVNDVEDREGKSVLKDPDLVTRLVSTPEGRAKHRRDLLELLEEGGYDGLDIDYEKVKAADWPAFLDFCSGLASELAGMGKRLRVVLEPSPAYYKRSLPPGPEYVVMAYNLFGGHSGPGPKANPAFLARLAGQARSAGADIRLALSTGGFVWPDKGKAKSVTEAGAAELAVKHNAEVFRDPDSRYLRFGYTEEDVDYTVWYADAVTLRHLVVTGRRMGFKTFDIWRLGGLSAETLEMFAKESLAAAPAAAESGRVLSVGPGRRFKTISQALAAAVPGDRIEVDPGDYAESIRVTQPDLTIACTPGLETAMPVRVTGPERGAALFDGQNTLWRGVTFVGTGDNAAALDGFTGRFEHCGFVLEGGDAEGVAVAVYDGGPEFQSCVFKGRGGTGVVFNSYPVEPGCPGGLIDFMYCLFEGFTEEAVHLADTASARLANCVLVRNGTIIRRSGTAGGTAALVNSILYNNISGTLVNSPAGRDPVAIENCIVTPVLNNRFWLSGFPLPDQPGVAAADCLVMSPRFVRAGRRLLLNLGIDDAVNIDVFDEVSGEAERYGFPMTMAVNTGNVDREGWDRLRDFLRRGHEVGSHTVGHTAVEIDIPMAVGYENAAGAKATLTIERGKFISASVDGVEAVRISLEEKNVNLMELSRRLRRYGFVAHTSHIYANNPASLLAGVRDLDVTFPNPVVPLYLDADVFLEQQVGESYRSLRKNLPEASELPFINPFAVTSPMVRRKIAQAGFTTSRAVVPLAVGEEELRANLGGTIVFSPFNIPCRSLGDTPSTGEEDPLVQSFLMMLDAAKENFFGFSFYAHTYDEVSLEQWKRILKLIAEDPNVKPATLTQIAREAKASGEELGDDMYRVRLGDYDNDYRLLPDSPGLKKGKPIGLAFDFAGNPVDPDSPPNIGLFQ